MPKAQTSKKKRTILLIIIVLIAIAATACLSRSTPASRAELPIAESGYLDLSGWDFEKDGNVKLDGEWEFYWGQLLTPGDFSAVDQKSLIQPVGWAKVPAAWNGAIANGHVSDKGVATYRLRVKLGAANLMYGLKTISIRMSNRIFVDGFEVGKSGSPAMSRQDGYVMGNTPYVTTFRPLGDEVVVIVQVADFDYKAGGIVQSIYLGHQSDIFAMAKRANFMNEFVAAALFVTGLYYLSVFLGRRQDLSMLYYSAYTITFFFFELVYGEKIFLQLFPEFPAALALKTQIVLLYASIILACLFIKEITRDILPNRLVPIVAVVLGGYMLTLPFLPLATSTSVENLFLLFGMVVYAVIAVFLALALRRKQYGELDKTGIICLLGAFVFVLTFFANGVLYVNNLINDNYIGYAALLFFTVIVPMTLSRQYNHAYSTIARQSVQLLALDKLKDEFLANTSHELRTPLNGIINITNSVIESSNDLSLGQRQSLQVVVTAARRLHNLINDILDISSLNNGEIRLSKTSVDLCSVVELVLYVLGQSRGDREVELINHIPADFPPVDADVERLRQILYNLIGNAIKFTQVGRVEIGADIRQDQAEIWIADTGCGIPADRLEEVFQPFYQVDAAETREAGGTGLGLSIARTLIELHGGRIWAQSTAGVGSRFSFNIPICQRPGVPAYRERFVSVAPDVTISELTSTHEVGTKRYSVLAADDDPGSLTALFNILDSDGYDVKAVASGSAVLQELGRQQSYDLVILDVMMPKMSGYQVLEQIRQRWLPIDLPVLMLTAKTRAEDLQAGFAAGANDYIAKPFEASELRARVRTLAQLKESVSSMLTSELAFLQAQIKPHFLFNSLGIIAALCTRDPQRAQKLIHDLANYLRGSFKFDNSDGITRLHSELETVRAYVSIERERFQNRLRLAYDIDESIDIPVPLLTIQPLVENAIRHGILKKPTGGVVRLSVRAADEAVVIAVSDDGVGIPAPKLAHLLADTDTKAGVGLKNIHRRLILHYGQGLSIESVEGQGTTVTLRIPLR